MGCSCLHRTHTSCRDIVKLRYAYLNSSCSCLACVGSLLAEAVMLNFERLPSACFAVSCKTAMHQSHIQTVSSARE